MYKRQDLIREFRRKMQEGSLEELFKYITDETGYIANLKAEETEEAEGRIEKMCIRDREMRERVDDLVGFGAEHIWVSTFHSTCVRILRRHIDKLGYGNSFTIYDADDQKSLIKQICKQYKIDTKMMPERRIINEISSAKDEFMTPSEYETRHQYDFKKKKIAQIYKEYQKQLKANNALAVSYTHLDVYKRQMYNTFNMGLGMVVAVDKEDVDKTMEAIKAAGDTPYIVGHMEAGEKGVTLC